MFQVGVGAWTMQSTYTSPRPFGDLYREALHHAQLAERLGLDSFDLGEHHNSYDGYLPASLAVASAVLARTSRITVGLGALLLPLQSAARVAEGAAAVASFAPNRLRIVLGLGWRQIEYAATGVDRRERKALMDSYSHDLFDGPLAERVNGVQLWFGGGAPPTLKRAAHYGASFCHTFTPVEVLRDRVAFWRSNLAPARPHQPTPKTLFGIDVWVDRNAPRCTWIKQRMREQWRFYTEMDSLPADVTGNPEGVEATLDMLNSYSLVGPPEQIVEQLAPYVKFSDGVVCRIWFDGLDTRLTDECMTLLANEVAPALRRLA